MSFREKWISLLFAVATGNRRKRSILTPVGALGFFSFIALFLFAFYRLDTTLKLPRMLLYPYNIAASGPFLILGLLLVLWCVVHFLTAKGTPVPFNPPERLVTGGPYRYTRNPMLTGLFSILFGIGLMLNSILVSFVFTPLFIFLNVMELKYIEEPELEKRLGKTYREYKQRVPMFIPGFRSTGKK